MLVDLPIFVMLEISFPSDGGWPATMLTVETDDYPKNHGPVGKMRYLRLGL